MFNRDALFGNRQTGPPPGGHPQRQPIQNMPQDPRRQERHPQHPQPGPRRLQLQPVPSPKSLIFANLCAVHPQDIPPTSEKDGGGDIYLLINGIYVLSARPTPEVRRGEIGVNDFQRTWMQVALTDAVDVEVYDPFRQGASSYLGSLDVEAGFAGSAKTAAAGTPIDQDELAQTVMKVCRNQIFAPGQGFGIDYKSLKLKLVVRTVELVDLASLSAAGGGNAPQVNPQARGILTPESVINFFKDAKSPINLRGSTKRPSSNSVIRPDFKFEQLGIGGLDKEFSDIFRRAFATRIFPPGLVEKLGMQHVRGILLYGPPGTGKTLIARQIGKMLNAREPKVVNGPEVLNKYVGQSEENIRKLFADAEKEQKEKGDESGLHIIIFDELDAVCKQRGSGAGGGTGVGDSVVNQLLSKLDGVEQLNNILLIGMTNRKDMIDEALLRPGRLEVHMEINLPDEAGRAQILKIHTAKMRDHGKLAPDVDIRELAKRTRNFSGAEISGLIKSAGSFALGRHIKADTVAAMKDDIDEMQLQMNDFLNALEEVKPLFGVSEEDLEYCIRRDIIHFGPQVDKILEDGREYVQQVRTVTPLLSVLLHGPKGSGKTALAAKIALESKFPFIKLVRPIDMNGMNEIQKIQYLSKVFTDAYKSPLNLVLLDDIDLMVDWVPVGPRFSSSVLAAIKALTSNQPPKNRPLLILATTSESTVLQQLQLEFDVEIPIPNLRSQNELANVMRHSKQFNDQEISRAINEIQQTTGVSEIRVGIKQIWLAIEKAMQSDDKAAMFAERMCFYINKANGSF